MRIGTHNLFDEWDENYTGVLANETKGAPRIHRIGVRRWRDVEEYSLEPKHVVHEEQLVKTFEHEIEEDMEVFKNYHAKVINVADIARKGLEMNVKKRKVKIVGGQSDSSGLQGPMREVPPVPHDGFPSCLHHLSLQGELVLCVTEHKVWRG